MCFIVIASFQKLLRGIRISTLFFNSNIPAVSTTSTFLLPPTITIFSAFLNGPSLLYYLFLNYYQTTGALFVLPLEYISNYYILLAILSTKIYNAISRRKIEAIKL